MIVKADLKCKQTDFDLPKCSIEKLIRLTPSEYTAFVSEPLGYYDFLREFNAEGYEYSPDSIPCLLLIGKCRTDGFIIDTQGYDYAWYTAHIPNAGQLAIAFKYPSLDNAVRETALVADAEMQKMLKSGSAEYVISIDEARNRFRCAGFSAELLYAALKDRPEMKSAEFDGAHILCKVKNEYTWQKEQYRELTQDDAEIMIAKHILWLNDAGGEQADFSNCLVRELNLAHKNMMNTIIDNARFIDTDLRGAELNSSVIGSTRFENCNLKNVTAEECKITDTMFSGCEMTGGIYTHSDLSRTVMIDCKMSYGIFQNCCTDGTNFCGLDYYGEINMQGCNSDREEWQKESLEQELTI